MSFVQPAFVAFLAIVFAAYLVLPRRGQNLLLIVASFLFYGWVHPWFVGLLLYSATLDYGCARGMASFPDRRRWFLGLSIVGNAGLLGTFKYLDFFIENVATALEALGVGANVHTLGILLPVGISFYTFQTLAYTIDVYWGKLEARRNFLDVLLYVSFFPQLVAGPIERAGRLLPQIESDRVVTAAGVRSGASLALFGAVKKVLVADTLAPYVDAIYATPDPAPAMVWAAAAGFMVQMLADFSAYTDIARGVARMLGFELMQNFDHPYLAAGPGEFWQRWHISFSEWLRDYVFYPSFLWTAGRRWLRLPGVSATAADIARATVITMLFSGLWHGAAWHFVLWGALWAALQLVCQGVGPRLPAGFWTHTGVWGLRVAGMWVFNLVAHQVFREPSLHRLVGHFTRWPLAGTADEHVLAVVMLALAGAGAGVLSLALASERWLLPRVAAHRWFLPIETGLWAVAALIVFTFSRPNQADFLYFAF